MVRRALQSAAPALLALLLAAACGVRAPRPQPADRVLVNGRVYTLDARRGVAEAVAIRGGEIVHVGRDADALRYAGDRTIVDDLEGRFVMPGLHDVHIHALGIAQPDVCDLASQPRALDELVVFLRDCLARYPVPEGEWLWADQWNFSAGNQPSARHPTLRAALDAVSRAHPIILFGSDGHHAGVNSAALARARDARGQRVGLSRETLAAGLASYRALVAVDAQGEPTGGLTESAVALTEHPARLELIDYDALMPEVARLLAASGITSIQDAMIAPEALDLFLRLEASGNMSFRMRAALFAGFPRSEEALRMLPGAVETFKAARERCAGSQWVRADAAKIFVDGVMEGDPQSRPPTLPNAAMLHPYRQPIFAFDAASGSLELRGHVDVEGPVCQQLRKDPAAHRSARALREFEARHGFLPAQCMLSSGVLEHSETFVHAFVREMERAGFAVHAHAIGDRAVRVALDAFEASRVVNGPPRRPQSLAHAQLIHPYDRKRIGALGVYVAFTYAWIAPERAYDLSVIPFVDEVKGAEDLYDPRHYYVRNAYPARSVLEQGGILVAGSDAPVDTRSPRPFVNIEQALTRAAGGIVLNEAERIDVHQALAAYTIHGAALLGQAARVGSIEVGKRADLIVLDRDPVALAETGRAEEIGDTRVLLTLFDGRVVHDAR